MEFPTLAPKQGSEKCRTTSARAAITQLAWPSAAPLTRCYTRSKVLPLPAGPPILLAALPVDGRTDGIDEPSHTACPHNHVPLDNSKKR